MSVIVVLLWLLLPSTSAPLNAGDYGLWSLVPDLLQQGWLGKLIGVGFASLSVYIMAELNNANVLLRISSRMLSSTYAFLLGVLLCLHTFQPALVVGILVLVAYASLFAMYQLPSPLLSFVTFMLVSSASLLFPKLLFFIVLYWVCMVYLRAFTFRSFVASLLGAIVPYWFFVGIAFSSDHFALFSHHIISLIDLRLPDYSGMTFPRLMLLLYVIILFGAGMVDFYTRSFLDKTRTRIIYNVVAIHGMFVLLCLLAQPQYFEVMMSLLIMDTSILFGHYISLTYNKFTHILCLITLVLAVAVLAVQVLNISVPLPWVH